MLAWHAHGASEVDYTSDPDANRLLRADNNAFLFGVIFDQGISYERAWRAPLMLKRRLGHLNMKKLAGLPIVEIRMAVRGAKKGEALHRFPAKMARWLRAAARKLVGECHGNAGTIWRDCLTAGEAIEWLREFSGIGQKKAHMMARLLHEGRAGKKFARWQDINVAVDVHVRRVFKRRGLAPSGKSSDILSAATRLHPRYPGALDEPAWRLGLEWCGPRPDCDGKRHTDRKACPVRQVCPRLSRGQLAYGR
jgi:uncharacterized HhH-GPD family protein